MKKLLRSLLLRQIGEAAAQEERNRLARDLHDSIKQQLFSINVSTAAAQERWDRDPAGAKAALTDVRRSAKVRKDSDPEVFLAAVRGAARGQSVLDPAVAGSVLQDLVRGGPLIEELSEREKDVLRQLAHGRTNQEIAEHLHVSPETVKTHVGNILSKLQLSHRTQAVVYALKQGLVSIDDIEI
jgi:DNA-binding NarL/FixJ family response regulator